MISRIMTLRSGLHLLLCSVEVAVFYFLMVVFEGGADKFWYIVFFSSLVTTTVLFKRVLRNHWHVGDWQTRAAKLELG